VPDVAQGKQVEVSAFTDVRDVLRKGKMRIKSDTNDFNRVGRLNGDTSDQRVVCRDGFQL